MKERRDLTPVPSGLEIERIVPMSRKEIVDVVAGALCRCPSCQKTAEPSLVKFPLLRDLDRNKASDLWTAIKEVK